MLAFKASLQSPEAVVLAGAGISFLPPTSLPLGDQLRDEVVISLLDDERWSSVTMDVLRSQNYQRILPEVLFQEISKYVSKEIDAFMVDRIGGRSPNSIHHAIARLGCPILTTNFDMCLEGAGAESVFHLHGDVSDPESLQNRIYRLQASSGELRQVATSIINSKRIFVLGYSLRDEDVQELLKSCQQKEIWYLSYDGNLPDIAGGLECDFLWTRGSFEDVLDISDGFCNIDNHCPGKTSIYSAPDSSNRLLAMLALATFADEHGHAIQLAKHIPTLLKGVRLLQALMLSAESARVCRKLDQAVKFCNSVILHADPSDLEHLNCLSTAYVVLALIDVDDRGLASSSALENLRRALFAAGKIKGAFKRGGDKRLNGAHIWIARIINNIGIWYRAAGELEKAKSRLVVSVSIKRRLNDYPSSALTYGNLAQVNAFQRDHIRALHFLRLARDMLSRSYSRYVCQDIYDQMKIYACESELSEEIDWFGEQLM